MNETEIKSTPAGTETPVDSFVQKLLAESQNPEWLSRWRILQGGTNGMPRYQYIDTQGLSAVLSCAEKPEEHAQYTLRCRKDGKLVMSSSEWTLAQEYSALGTLYERIDKHAHQKSCAPGLTPQWEERYIGRTDQFARALLKDARSPSPALRWVQDTYQGSPAFRSDGLGKADSHIWVIQHHTADSRDPSEIYSLSFERDGKMVLACTETCRGESEDAELQQLYHLLSRKAKEARAEVPEVDAFNMNTDCRLFLDRILKSDFPTTTPVLIGDLFRQAMLRCVVRMFVYDVVRRNPGLETNDVEKLRLQQLATATVNAIRYSKRAPSDATFTPQTVSGTNENDGAANNTVRMTASLQRISNAYTTWPAEVFVDSTPTRQARVNRTCVLLLMAILKDELP